MTAVTNDHKLSGLDDIHLLSHDSIGQKSSMGLTGATWKCCQYGTVCKTEIFPSLLAVAKRYHSNLYTWSLTSQNEQQVSGPPMPSS